MTLTIAWVRRVGEAEELVFASDSRLRGGEAWDCCPKLMLLPRGDCAIAFAGSTWWAYPLMLQMARAIELYPGSMRRTTDISDAKGQALRVFEQMLSLVDPTDLTSDRDVPERPDTEFLFGGFSWREAVFRVWRLHFDNEIDRYTFAPVNAWPGQAVGTTKLVAFAGDVSAVAKERLTSLLRERGKLQEGSLDMEPFEVLRDMIRTGDYPTLGGAPQVAKVYRYLRTQGFGVRWPDSDGPVCVDGRPTLPYEQFDVPVIDPDQPNMFLRPRNLGQPYSPAASPHPLVEPDGPLP